MFKKHGARRGAVKIRGFDLDVKASADTSGKFTGHGSVFGIEDSYGEMVERPRCKRCEVEMDKVRTTPKKPGYETDLYRCSQCQFEAYIDRDARFR